MKKRLLISNEEIKELVNNIDEQLVQFIKDGKYKDVLLLMGNISKYSLTNQLYIFSQFNNARTLKGIKEWNALKRSIKKGEKAIKVLAPIKKTFIREKEENGNIIKEKIKNVIGYKHSYVFDISQTEGDDIQTFEMDKNISLDNKDQIIQCLISFINKKGYQVSYANKAFLGEGCYGQCRYKEKRIYILDNMSNLEEISTLIHECAHALAHSPYKEGFEGLLITPTRDIKEVEAESIACIVCSYLGYDTKEYNFSYILSWANGDIKKFRSNIEVISFCAKEIISCLSN
ncbi:MAG TPA: hypothetical protein DDW20_04215 [Firmicutes bacterium]|nr:hypothetical protein [Bacillota bacterium]